VRSARGRPDSSAGIYTHRLRRKAGGRRKKGGGREKGKSSPGRNIEEFKLSYLTMNNAGTKMRTAGERKREKEKSDSRQKAKITIELYARRPLLHFLVKSSTVR